MKFFRTLAIFAVAGPLAIVCSGQEKSPLVTPMAAAVTLQEQPAPTTPADKGKKAKKEKGKKQGAADGSNGASVPATLEDCGKLPVQPFAVDASGNVSDTGKTLVGPVCVDVFYNPIQSFVSLATNTTTVPGPDLGKVVLGASSQGGELPKPPVGAKKNISNTFHDEYQQEISLKEVLSGRKSSYGKAVNEQEVAIAAIAKLRRTTLLLNPAQLPLAVRNGYKNLKDPLLAALQGGTAFTATDQVDNRRQILLAQLQQLADDLAGFPLRFSDAPKVSPDSIAACNPDADSGPTEIRPISWADWSTHCKEQYGTLTKQVTADIQEAQNYTTASENIKRLKSRIAVVQYWDSIFANMGLRTTLVNSDIDKLEITGAFHASKPVKCGTLFNQTANTTVNVVVADLGPTLEGNDPTTKAQGAFVTVGCSTPFSVTAGVAFSTIEQKEFAIVKSSGGLGKPSVNTFASLNDSHIHPMPMGMVHVRLAEWGRHKYAFHGSFGVAGNIQGQSSGGSSAEFLPSVSISFWRTMYLSLGPHIGTKSALAGGFQEGDPVPSDITTIQGQVKRSYTVGFGFAVTFTKP